MLKKDLLTPRTPYSYFECSHNEEWFGLQIDLAFNTDIFVPEHCTNRPGPPWPKIHQWATLVNKHNCLAFSPAQHFLSWSSRPGEVNHGNHAQSALTGQGFLVSLQILACPYIPPSISAQGCQYFTFVVALWNLCSFQLGLCSWWYFAPEKSFKGLQHRAVTEKQKSKTDSAPESIISHGSGLHLCSMLHISSRISLLQITTHNEELNVHKREGFSHSLTVHQNMNSKYLICNPGVPHQH